jgi:sugar phosphate isomerase/epimerase
VDAVDIAVPGKFHAPLALAALESGKACAHREIAGHECLGGAAMIGVARQADREQAWFECAALAGARRVPARFDVHNFGRAIDKVRSWPHKFGIHPHGGRSLGGQPDVIEHLLSLGAPEIGLCLATAWVMQIGPHAGNPLEGVKKFPKSIYALHYKDYVFGRDGSWSDVVVGEGNLRLPELFKALDDIGFDGMAVLEYEADIENPVPALRRCVESMRAAA